MILFSNVKWMELLKLGVEVYSPKQRCSGVTYFKVLHIY